MIAENNSNPGSSIAGDAQVMPDGGRPATRGQSNADLVKDVIFQTMLASRLDTSLDALCALNGWSISPELAVWLLEYIDRRNPRRLIEFGSGVSTLLIADALRRQGYGRLLSIEHNEKYYESTKTLLANTGLTEFVCLALCPLETIELNGEEHCWYGIPEGLMADFLAGVAVDFVLVDGPPRAVQKHARYPALPVLRSFVNASSLIVLDDAARDDEAEVAERWVAESEGKLKCEMMTHMRRSPALLFAGKSPRLLMLDNDDKNMPVINHENVVGPMTDYVTALVKRNLLRLEVAEGIALKHQLLLQTEESKRIQRGEDHQRELAAASIALAEAKQANMSLEQELAKARAESDSFRRECEETRLRLERVEVEACQIGEERDGLLEKQVQLEGVSFDLRRQVEDIERHSLGMSGEITQLKNKCTSLSQELSELRSTLADTEHQRDSNASKYKALRAEFEILKQSEMTLMREKAALVKQHEVNEKISSKRVENLTSRVEELKGTVSELKERNSDSKSRLLALKASMDESTLMSKEVFAWVDTLQRELLRTGHDLEQTTMRLARTKQHLSYRLGGVLVNNTGSLKGILSIPGKLLQQKREFVEFQRQTQRMTPEVTGPHLNIDEGINYSYARTRWRTLQINAREQGASIALSLLTPSVGRAVSIEICCAQTGVVYLQAVDGKAKQLVGQEPVRLDMISDGHARILHIVPEAGPVVVSLRRSTGVSAIVKLHMMPLDPSIADYRPKPVPALTAPSISNTISGSGLVGLSEPKPMKSAIIWQAHQMMQEGRAQDAIEFAKKHARDFIRPAVELLIANSRKDSEDIWLSSLNRYLAQFGISPLAMAAKGENRFLRLISQSRETHEGGPLISVIMPAFNSARTIEHSVRSILNQTWRNIELFVIDDASEDDTGTIVRKIAAQDPRVKIVRNARNVGPYVSKNLALQFCQGEYITGHDADDWAHPDRLAGQVRELLNSGGHLKGNMAKMIRMMADGTFVHFAKEGKTSDDGVLRDAAISCMFEREFFQKHLGHWDCVRFGADSELISRAQKIMQDRFVKVRHMTMICLDNEGSLTNDPIHGVSKVTGISPTRKFYRDQWTNWHARMEPIEAILPFPYYENRKFAVPEAAAVLTADILENLNSIKSSLRGA